MGFWIFMFSVNLLIPMIMLVFGIVFSKNAPKDINYIFGYRTTRSMKNQETWEFAHRRLGKVWKLCALSLFIIAIVPMLFVIGKNKGIIGNCGMVIIYVELAVLLLSLIPVEIALKRKFKDDGSKKE